MTSLFKWSEAFATHLPSVDKQHLRLVGLINDFGEQVMSAEVIDPQAFAAVRDGVLDYTKVHFSDEESLMEKARLDPRHVEHHRAEHQSFVVEALALGEIGDTISLARARALVTYLVQWLACHILGVDQSMARQIRAVEGGQSPTQAFDNDARYIQTNAEPLLVALRGLAQTISKRNAELRALNRELEQRVKQRTIDLEHANHELQLLSTKDELTGLPNRRFAALSLQQLWVEAKRYGSPLSLLMLDADHFKEINDRFGHAEGDTVMRALATLLRNAVRRSDVVCRFGDDEFLVICPRTSWIGAAEVAKTILAELQPFCNADGVECWNGAMSIGLAEAAGNMTQPADLLQAADQAMYAAKRQGGACMAGEQNENTGVKEISGFEETSAAEWTNRPGFWSILSRFLNLSGLSSAAGVSEFGAAKRAFRRVLNRAN